MKPGAQDLVVLAGALLIVAGVGWMYPPAGVIAGGIALVVVGFVWAELSKQEPRPPNFRE